MKRSSHIQFAIRCFAILAAIFLIAGATRAYAQTDLATAKMTITGIAGDNADGSMEVAGIDQRVVNPPNTAASRTPPAYSIVVTKKIDRATPHLFLTAMNGGVLRLVKITWTRINPTTKLEEFSHSITLRDVLLTSIRQRPANPTDPDLRQDEEYEELTFTVGVVTDGKDLPTGSIEWTYALSGGRTIVTTQWDFAKNRGI